MVVPSFFSHRPIAGITCVANHLDLKADSTDRCPVYRNPHGSRVLSPFAVSWYLKTEGRRLRMTSPDKRVHSLREDKTFDFHVKRKGRANRGIENQGPMAALLTFRIKLLCSRLGLLPVFWGVKEDL